MLFNSLPKLISPTGLVLLFLLAGCSGEQPQEVPESRPVPVRISQVRQLQVQQSIPVSGTVVSPFAPTRTAFLVAGQAADVTPREGEFVHRGQLLARLDATEYQAAVTSARAEMKRAEIAASQARDEFERMDYLFQRNSLPRNDYEKFKAAREAAEQQLVQARANVRIHDKHLADTRLFAPVSGFISKRLVEPGQSVAAGIPVFEIVRLDPVEILVGVPETDIHQVTVGQKATVTLPALPGQTFEGTVRVVNVSADPSTRSYMARIAIANPEHRLQLGMVAKAQIVGTRQLNVLTLPAVAVVRDPQGAPQVYVYYARQQRVHTKRVTLGTIYGDEIEIKAGLQGDEQIVVAGQEKLRDGIRVVLAQAAAAQPQTVEDRP